MIKVSSDTAGAIRAFLRARHPRGVTAGQLRQYVPLAAKRTPDEVRAYLTFLATQGLAAAEDVPAAVSGAGPGYKRAMQVYTATDLLMDSIEKGPVKS